MNPVLSQITRAQDAYMGAVKVWEEKGTDVTGLLLQADASIKASVAQGALAAWVPGITDPCVAEKLALELQKLGYATAVQQGGQIPQPDGSLRQSLVVTINFKWMPGNSRDEFTI